MVAKAMLVQRVSSTNFISQLCEETGADASEISRMLSQDGTFVHAYDPKVKKEDAMADFKYKDMDVNEDELVFANSPKEAANGSKARVVLTAWDECRHYPYAGVNPC